MQLAETKAIRDISELEGLSRAELISLAQRTHYYHTIDFGDVVIQGDFDHRPHLPAYRFPDLRGKRVLDVGRASGFFSFHFERMGADVTATELPPGRAKNVPGLVKGADDDAPRLDFPIAQALLGSKVRPVFVDVGEISRDTVGDGYDLIFVGSLLVHLADPMGSLSRMRPLLAPGGVCIIANPIERFDHVLSYFRRKPIARLTPARFSTSWWLPNIPCLIEMCRRSGFEEVRLVTRNLPLRWRGKRKTVRHAVVHASAGSEGPDA